MYLHVNFCVHLILNILTDMTQTYLNNLHHYKSSLKNK